MRREWKVHSAYIIDSTWEENEFLLQTINSDACGITPTFRFHLHSLYYIMLIALGQGAITQSRINLSKNNLKLF